MYAMIGKIVSPQKEWHVNWKLPHVPPPHCSNSEFDHLCTATSTNSLTETERTTLTMSDDDRQTVICKYE